MIKRIYALMLIPLLAASCSKSEPAYDKPNSDTAISFAAEELTADWGDKSTTRGVAVDDINNLTSSIMVYSFLTTPNESTTGPLINHKEALKDASDIWSFKPAYYYPLGEKLDFLAYTPKANLTSGSDNNGLIQTLDFDNKSVKFDYATPEVGRNHPDLMLATPATGCSSVSPVGALQFNHVLTKITMSAKMADGTDAEYLDRYKITRFTLHNIKTSGSLDYNITSIGEWYDGDYGNFIVQSLLPGESPEDYPGETATLLTDGDEYVDIMNNGEALFMIPQPIEASTNVNGKPSIQITLTDTKPTNVTENGVVTTTYLTYRTDLIELPSYNGEGWKKGQSIDLQFEFKFDGDMVVIPMSIITKLIPWTSQTVDNEVDPNIYAWLDTNNVNANETTTLKLYTNGELKSISGMNASFGDKVGDYYPVTVTAGDAGQSSFEVMIDNSHDGTITKKFYINVE